MEYALLSTIIASIVTAFAFGMAAKKLHLPSIFGYLLAGMAIGPFTPGFVADVALAQQLAEIGIILLMFGVGLHFSLDDLKRVRRIALPGALVQMPIATLAGAGVALAFGFGGAGSLVFGLALSVASTVVLLRTLEQHGLVDSRGGKIAIGWLIVEDIAMVLAIVMLPVFDRISQGDAEPGFAAILLPMVWVLIKIGVFFAGMLLLGRRFLPRLLKSLEAMQSPELTVLGVMAIALGFAALAYTVFDASLALGAFLAGMMLNGTKIGRRSAESTLPMRDTFSVLFFVSVGMLFDPATLVNQTLPVILTFLTIVVVKSLAALAITRLFRQPRHVSYTIAIGLAQIGEFSFILGSIGLAHGLLTQELYNLILAGALLSIVVNPFLFRVFVPAKAATE